MKRYGYLAFVMLLAVSFVAGYWPQHKKLLQAQGKLAETSARLSKAESIVHLCQLQAQLVILIQETENKNYADASGLSSKFFDGLRQEVANTPPSGLKSSLQSALSQRDAVTAALAKGDPKAHDLLEQILVDFSQNVIKTDSETESKN
jgi:hypothetical protein